MMIFITHKQTKEANKKEEALLKLEEDTNNENIVMLTFTQRVKRHFYQSNYWISEAKGAIQ